MKAARTTVQGQRGERGIRADVQPGLETFARLATVTDLIRTRVATRLELIGISDDVDWPAHTGRTYIGGITLPADPPRPNDVTRLASMIAADIIVLIDTPSESLSGPIGLQLRLGVDSKGIECTYRITPLEREEV